MAERQELKIEKRELLGKATKYLRRAGLIPANIYGHKEAPVAVQIDAAAFDLLRRSHGTRNVLNLLTPDGTQMALVRHVQHSPTGKILHIDFARVNLTERLQMKVALQFVGESAAVKNEGGMLLSLLDALEVECQASNIVEVLEVDITPLTELNAMLHAKDVKLPANYTLITNPEEPIVKIDTPRVQEEETTTAEAAPAESGEGAEA